jgi:hypothetical protein
MTTDVEIALISGTTTTLDLKLLLFRGYERAQIHPQTPSRAPF